MRSLRLGNRVRVWSGHLSRGPGRSALSYTIATPIRNGGGAIVPELTAS